MRHLHGFFVLSALLALPRGAGAEAGEETIATEAPALKLEVDSSGLETEPGRPPTIDGYTLPEMKARVNGARAGLAAFGAVGVIGAGFLIAGARYTPSETEFDFTELKYFVAGGSLVAVGVIGLGAMGTALAGRKHDLRELEAAQRRRARRFRWDIARSRLVF